MTNPSYAGAPSSWSGPVRNEPAPNHIIVAQSRLAALQAMANKLALTLEAGEVPTPADQERLEATLTLLDDQIEALDQQIAAYWKDRAWGGR